VIIGRLLPSDLRGEVVDTVVVEVEIVVAVAVVAALSSSRKFVELSLVVSDDAVLAVPCADLRTKCERKSWSTRGWFVATVVS
jgi:hypothetical protein